MSTIIDDICEALSRYYKSLDKPYDKLFSTYCEDNGLDDVAEELKQPPEDCLLVDFDDDFPFEKEPKDRPRAIFDMIIKCNNIPNITFDVPSPILDQDSFRLEEKTIDEIKITYKKQCPVLWNSGMSTDGGFIQILGVGKKNNFDYLLHLVDDYSRSRVKHIDEQGSWTEKNWIHNHKHFNKLKNMKVNVPNAGTGINSKVEMKLVTADHLAEMAVVSFGKRCTPKLLFTSMLLIDDDLETTVQFFNAAVEFISNIAKSKSKTICPFQMDVCIAVGEPKSVDKHVGMPNNNDQDDDEDDDDDDNDDDIKEELEESKSTYVDCVGDIKKKLDENKLKHKMSVEDLTNERRLFADIYEGFIKDNKLEQKDDKTDYLHKKRLVTFVDRRGKGVESNVWMFEPPENCRKIPDDAVPEWYISASRTCLLPNMEYGDGYAAIAAAGNEKVNEKSAKKVDNVTKLKMSNIGASFHCKGGLLTFSFHVKQVDVIKCYLYYNGQVIRFMAEDIKTVLPKIFNMDYGQNRAYIEKEVPEKDLEGMIDAMKKKLVDKEFEAFRQNYR